MNSIAPATAKSKAVHCTSSVNCMATAGRISSPTEPIHGAMRRKVQNRSRPVKVRVVMSCRLMALLEARTVPSPPVSVMSKR